MKTRITKIFTFEMGHALQNYDGLCKNIHGHSYSLEVTISGEPVIDRSSPKLGMVMDFGDLKKIIKKIIVDVYDHALVVRKGYDIALLSEEALKKMKLIVTDFQPTSEQLIAHFSDIIKQALPAHITLERLKLNETGSSYAEWLRSDQ